MTAGGQGDSQPPVPDVRGRPPTIDGRRGRKVAPYGVYDQTQNIRWVNVGTDHDTAALAVASIRRWWNTMGQQVGPNVQRLLFTADSGDRNGSRTRRWKTEVEKVANDTGLEISVCHLPPGQANGTRLNIGSFPTSVRTGEGNLSSATR